MHEMSLATSLLAILQDEVGKRNIIKITRIKVVVGEMVNLAPQAFRFAFSSIAVDTPAADAELEIDVRPIKARCYECGETFLVVGYVFCCPCCNSSQLDIISGNELYIDSFIAEGDQNNESERAKEPDE